MERKNLNKNRSQSERLFLESSELFPSGVNSPVRAFRNVDASPVFINSASGCRLFDVDGNSYIDYIGSWGPAILGHSHPEVIEAIKEEISKGLSFGTCCENEIKLGKLVKEYMPNIQMLRFVSSGTEACMSAVRLARAYTQKKKIIKFSGNYHGHFDSFLVKAGSGATTFGIADSLGVLPELAGNTLIAKYNNLESVKELFAQNPDSIACVIIEPIVGNSGCLLPKNNFLKDLENLCKANNALFILDEVMTGFRVSRGGAQEIYDLKPDLITLGKIIGGGLPVGAYGGKKEIMQMISPLGGVYQAGTLSGNPISMIAGFKTLELLGNKAKYKELADKTKKLTDGLSAVFERKSFPALVNACTGMFTIFFQGELKPNQTRLKEINNFEDALTCDLKVFSKFFEKMLDSGVFLPPSQFEACFLSLAHGNEELEMTISAVTDIIDNL